MKIEITYYEEDISADHTVHKWCTPIAINVGDTVTINCTEKAAAALRDALAALLGAPVGCVTIEDAAREVRDMRVQERPTDDMPDDPTEAYAQGYAAALKDAVEELEGM